jgi:hypothetical protein
MKLEPLMTYHADLGISSPVGEGPHGNRLIVEVTGGQFEGSRLKGRILSGGGDWLVIDREGFGHLDVRATFLTDDGAYIYVQYYGVTQLTEAAAAALAGKGQTEFGDAYFFSQPRFETGDPRYAWLNHTMAVGQGRLRPNRVEYQVFAFAN